MMTEIFRRLRPFQPIEDYLYIGFGSLWFTDFALFHRTLGVKRSISMEREVSFKDRFDDNKPFAAVTMDYRDSSLVLPNADWSQPNFVWLDYDDPLKKSMLYDVQSVANRCASGTVLALTVQSFSAKEVDEAESDKTSGASAMVRFRGAIGADAVPPEASQEDLYGSAFGRLSQRILLDQIGSALSVRNGTLGPYDQMKFTLICDIEYRDGMLMKTFVGIFATVRDQNRVEQCGFENLDFIPLANRSIKIDVPILTAREIRYLERQLPKGYNFINYGSIPREHADNFAKLYRYLPNFAVLEH